MSDIYIATGSIVAGIAKEMSEMITDNDIDLESLDYDEIEEQFDIIKGHAMLVTKENEKLKKENEELKEQIYGIHDDEMDANGLLDDIEDLKRIFQLNMLDSRLGQLTKDNKKLQDEIEKLKDCGDICEEIAKLKEELEEEQDGRDHDVQQFQETLSEKGSLEAEVEELKEELKEKEKEVSLINSEEMENEEEIAKLKKENEELKEEYNMWKASHDDDIREAREEGKGANEIIEKLKDWVVEVASEAEAGVDQRFIYILYPHESEEEEEEEEEN